MSENEFIDRKFGLTMAPVEVCGNCGFFGRYTDRPDMDSICMFGVLGMVRDKAPGVDCPRKGNTETGET